MELSQVIEEIRLVPKDRLREIYNFIHFFRLGLEKSQDSTEDKIPGFDRGYNAIRRLLAGYERRRF